MYRKKPQHLVHVAKDVSLDCPYCLCSRNRRNIRGYKRCMAYYSNQSSSLSGASVRRAQSKGDCHSQVKYPSFARFDYGTEGHCPSAQRGVSSMSGAKRGRRAAFDQTQISWLFTLRLQGVERRSALPLSARTQISSCSLTCKTFSSNNSSISSANPA